MQPAEPTPTIGFAIRFRLTDGLGEDGALELWDDFVAGPLGARGLAYDAHPNDGKDLSRLLYRPNASATEDDRHVIREWARRRGEIADYDIGPLTSVPAAPSVQGAERRLLGG
jgi:uncharacterized protein YggL (DUF469 family)